MIVSDTHRFVFVDIPKAGTHSMQYVLFTRYSARRDGVWHDANIPQPIKDKGYFVFGITRNPYARACSIWWHLAHRHDYAALWEEEIGGKSFRTFVKWLAKTGYSYPQINGNIVLPPQCYFEGLAGGFDAMLRLDNLSEEAAAKLPFWTGPKEIDHRNSDNDLATGSDYGDWRGQYDEELASIVRRIYDEDFTRYGHDPSWR